MIDVSTWQQVVLYLGFILGFILGIYVVFIGIGYILKQIARIKNVNRQKE